MRMKCPFLALYSCIFCNALLICWHFFSSCRSTEIKTKSWTAFLAKYHKVAKFPPGRRLMRKPKLVATMLRWVGWCTCWRISCSSLAGDGMNPISQFSFTWAHLLMILQNYAHFHICFYYITWSFFVIFTFLPIHQLPSYFSNMCRKSPILKLKKIESVR